MPGVVGKRFLKGEAIYWRTLGVDDDGNKIYDDPVLLKVRWEDRTEMYLNAAGDTVACRSIVYCNQQITQGGILRQGGWEDIVDLVNPFGNPDAWTIQRADRIPNRRQTKFLYMAYL
jgi:hypothetical protein